MGLTGQNGRVSVVLATFNGERFIAEQLDSLRQQWRTPDELIVVDDASTDRTIEMVREFAEQAPFRVVVMDSTGRPIGRSRWRVAGFSPNEQAAMSRDPLGQMLARRVMSGCTAAIRRSLIDAVLPIPAPMSSRLDGIMYDHWISLIAAAAGPVVLVPRQLVDYRIHPAQQIGIPGLAIRRWAPNLLLRVAQFRANRDEIDRRMEFDSMHVEEIRTRLAATGLGSEATERVLDMAHRHLLSRKSLHEDRIRRVGDIVSELRHEDGYRRFALGAATAFADLTR